MPSSEEKKCETCGKKICLMEKYSGWFENAPCLYRNTPEEKDKVCSECHGHPSSPSAGGEGLDKNLEEAKARSESVQRAKAHAALIIRDYMSECDEDEARGLSVACEIVLEDENWKDFGAELTRIENDK